MKLPKRIFSFVVVPMLFSATIACGLAENALAGSAPGMLAFWKLEEDASAGEFAGYADETNNTSAGFCSVGCPAMTAEGAVDGGQTFFGNSTGIDISPNPIFDFTNSSNFSLELWFKMSSVVSREVLIGRGSTDSPMNWWLGVQPSGQLAFSLTSAGGITDRIESRPQKAIANNAWHHAAVVRYGHQTRLFVDGRLEASSLRVYDAGFESPNPINIGFLDNGGPAHHFNGTLDEIAIYNVSLSDKDILTHYYLSRDYRTAYDTPVRIMPMGDSITYDNRKGDSYPYDGSTGRPPGERTGYRWPLWNWLQQAEYRVDFVGSEQAGQDFFDDPDNAGFPGISDDQLGVLLSTGFNPRNGVQVTPGPYLYDYPSDVILLHIGTNDLASTPNGVSDILDEIDAYDPDITVVLARIINRVGGSAVTTQFNENLGEMAENRILNGDKIITVDMEYGSGIVYQLEPEGDMHDDLHPSNVVDPAIIDSGYGKMADVWYRVLDSMLPQPEPDCSDVAVSWWPLDESSGSTFIDALGSNHGIGGPNPAPVPGKVGGARNFNGVDTAVNVPADDAFNWADDDSFSIELWVKRDPAAMSGNEVMIGRDDGASSQMHWWAGLWNDGRAAFVLKGSNGTGSGDRETGEYLEGNQDLSDGIWHHVAVVRDAAVNENRLYVDGALNDFVSITYDTGEGFASAAADLNMGWLDLGGGYHFSGSLDEVVIYKRVLTAVEILQHFNGGSSYCPSPADGSSNSSGCFIGTLHH